MTETIKLPVTAQEVMNFSHQQRMELAEIVAGLLAGAGIDGLMAVELYGSVAQKQDGPSSDIDLLITYEGDPDVADVMRLMRQVAGKLIGNGVPVSGLGDGKQAAAGKVSLTFEADVVYQDPMSYWGQTFSIAGVEEMNFLNSVKRSARELWRRS